MSRAVDEAYSPKELCLRFPVGTGLADGVIGRGLLTWTIIECRIGISYSDRDSAPQLFRVPSSPYTRQGLDYCALSIVHVSQCANVNLRLDLQTLPS